MSSVGVLLLTIGVWIIYSGVSGISPLTVGMQILASPADASAIIAEAKDSANATANQATGGFSVSSAIKDYVAGSNPFSAFTLGDNWQTHLDRDSLGGLDYPMPVGTPLVSAFAGTVSYESGSSTTGAGNVATVTLSNGYKSQYLHVSKDTLTNGSKVMPGTVIALSGGKAGAPGAGSSTGPHVHWHMIDPQGKRINPLDSLKGSKAA